MTKTAVIIVAAGSGLRFGAPMPKQYCRLGDRPVVMHTIDAFRRILPDARLLLVISDSHRQLWDDLCKEHDFVSPHIIYGGDTRWQSVKNALDVLSYDVPDCIMVHDGARPIVSPKVIASIIDTLDKGADGVIPVTEMTDSLRRLDGSMDRSTAVDRAAYRAVQTPQAFPGERLLKAYTLPYDSTMTDDASVMQAAGFNDIRLVPGSVATLKITHPADIVLAGYYLENPPF